MSFTRVLQPRSRCEIRELMLTWRTILVGVADPSGRERSAVDGAAQLAVALGHASCSATQPSIQLSAVARSSIQSASQHREDGSSTIKFVHSTDRRRDCDLAGSTHTPAWFGTSRRTRRSSERPCARRLHDRCWSLTQNHPDIRPASCSQRARLWMKRLRSMARRSLRRCK